MDKWHIDKDLQVHLVNMHVNSHLPCVEIDEHTIAWLHRIQEETEHLHMELTELRGKQEVRLARELDG